MGQSSNPTRLSPSETLMAALERIDGAEDVVIIWRKKNDQGKDDVDWSINDAPFWRVLGLMEAAKVDMSNELREED